MKQASPSQSEQAPKQAADSQPLEYISNPFSISFKGLGLLADNVVGVFVTTIVVGFIGLVLNIMSTIADVSSAASPQTSTVVAQSSNDSGAAIFGAVLFFAISIGLLVFIASVAFSAALRGFVAAGSVRAIDGHKVSFGEALSAMTSRFGTLFVAEIMTTLRIIGGYLLLIIPGGTGAITLWSNPIHHHARTKHFSKRSGRSIEIPL